MFFNINTLKVGVCFLDDIDGEGTPILPRLVLVNLADY